MPPRRKKPAPVVVIETWTWEMAEEALKKNHTNRELKPVNIATYARLMDTNLWGFCTEPIVFDTEGYMIDGQNRCHAQVESKTTQTWLVLRGVPAVNQKHINTGIPRKPADQLHFEGYTNTQQLASIARWAYLLEAGKTDSGRFRVASPEILQMVEQHPDIVHSAATAAYAVRGYLELTKTPLGAAHWWIAQVNGHAEADLFYDRFVNLNREPDGSAITALVKRMREARRAKMYIEPRVGIAAIVKTWNYDVEGKYISKINLTGRHGEYQLQEVLNRNRPDEETPTEVA